MFTSMFPFIEILFGTISAIDCPDLKRESLRTTDTPRSSVTNLFLFSPFYYPRSLSVI